MPIPIPLTIVLAFFTAASLALASYWGVVLWHIARTMRRVPMARDGLKLERAAGLLKPDAPKVCVIVPAHNEEGVVGTLARSLVRQTYPNLSIVFSLDRCTDGTADEIRRETGGADRVEIIEVRDCPADWAGKVNAVHAVVGQSRAAREAAILLFTDADTVFDPECVRATTALLLERGLGMLSLMSSLTCDRWFERIAQPAAGIELFRQYPLVRANAREHRRAFANGQFMLFTREAYERMGGHEAVKEALLEDVALARLAERSGIPGGLILAGDMLSCRMYGSYAEFVAGWKRIYIESANRRVKRLRTIGMRLVVLGTILPAAAAACIAGGAAGFARWHDPLLGFLAGSGGVALALMMAALVWSYRISRTPVWCAMFYPIGAWQVAGILREAAADLENRVPVRWGGRQYVRESR